MGKLTSEHGFRRSYNWPRLTLRTPASKATLARHDAASGAARQGHGMARERWFKPSMGSGPMVGPDRHHGRCDVWYLFGPQARTVHSCPSPKTWGTPSASARIASSAMTTPWVPHLGAADPRAPPPPSLRQGGLPAPRIPRWRSGHLPRTKAPGQIWYRGKAKGWAKHNRRV